MNIFKKSIKEVEKLDKAIEEVYDNTPKAQPVEEWVWVEGFKGTDKNMCCRDFQYELGKQYDMLDDQIIKACESGFHLCLKLEDVFKYYDIGLGNRFFKVRALVRKTDKDKYGYTTPYWTSCIGHIDYNRCDKIAAKSIIFLSELTIDEICKPTKLCDLPYEYKQMAIEVGVENAITNYQTCILVEDGYSLPFASYMVERKGFNIAHAVGSQKDLSMDMKVLCILKEG